MVHAVKRADGIIRGLTDFAQHSKRHLREEDLSAILKQAITAVEPELNQHPILLSRELSESLPPVVVDFRSLKHVFINLLMRVIRALQPEGGRILVRSFSSTLDRPLVLNGKTFRSFHPNEEVLWAEVEVFPNRISEGAPPAPSNSSGLGFTVLKKIIELYAGVLEIMYPDDTGGMRYVVVFKSAKAAQEQPA